MTKYPDCPITCRPTVVEVDLGRLAGNVHAIARAVRRPIMGVVKANAYGHGLVPTAQALLACGVSQLGVAFLEEGIELRRAGITVPILVLGGLIGNQIGHFLDFELTIGASSPEKLRQIDQVAADTGRRAQVHLKIDTGMGRVGKRWDRADEFFEQAVTSEHCDVTGVFSHFADADAADKSFAAVQLDRFLRATSFFEREGLPTPTRHMANSGGVLQHPESWLDMVRPGILLYGIYPSPEVERTIAVEPVLSCKTRVVYFKVVDEGATVGYDMTWTAPRPTRVVTLPVGYGDGYSRALSNRGQVLIGGRRHDVIGRMSMDQCSVEIGDDSAYNGDEVVLIGAQGDERITVEDLAGWVGTIPYEILTMLNTRVPRQYVGDTLASGTA
ncbi:MAG: alanine racemase [Armatimonadetes bacterium]|nr:alanine racemase [Armatimonadota bacterium]